MGKEEHLRIMIWDLLYLCPQSCQSPAWLWGWFCKCRFTPSWTSSLEAPQGVRVSQRLLLKLSYACRSLGGLSWWLSGNEPSCQCRRHRFSSWVRKIPWRRKWQPTPLFLPGKLHGQRSLASYSPWGSQKSWVWLSNKMTRSLGEMVKMQVLIQRLWGRTWNSAFLTSFQVILMFPVHFLH